MRVHYYNRSTKYYTKYSQAKRTARKLATYAGYAALGLVAYAALYLFLVAAGAQY